MAKKSTFDTSFDFGANVASKKPKSGKSRGGKGKKPKASKSKKRNHFSSMYGS